MMATVAGAIFMLVLLGAPRHGIISKLAHRAMLSLRIVREDILGLLYRAEEQHASPSAMSLEQLRHDLLVRPLTLRAALMTLSRRGWITARAVSASYSLTDAGRGEARALLRSHRLWESYLVQELDVRADHSHRTAEHLEHVTHSDLQHRLEATIADDRTDPQGKPIPRS